MTTAEQPVLQRVETGPPVLPALWQARGSILLATVLATLVGYLASSLQPVRYEATAELLLADPRNLGVFRDTGTTFLDPSRYVRNQAEMARSTPVLARASELTGERLGIDAVREAVTVRPSVDLDLLTVQASDGTAAGAANLADAVARAYQEVVAEQVQSSADASLERLAGQRADLQAQIDAVDQRLRATPDDAALQAEKDAAVTQLVDIQRRADEIAVDTSLFGSGVDLYEEPEVPAAPAAPQPLRNAALAGVLGALAAGGIAWWRAGETALAERRNDAATVLGARLLGQVPEFEEVGMTSPVPTVSGPKSPAAEAYHFLVGALQHALAEFGGRSVLVTSARPGDGKTTTALNVGVAASQDGREILIVDADTRVRGLTRFSGLDPAPGMVDLTRPDVELPDCMALLRLSETVTVPFLTSGRMEGDAAAFFRTAGFRRALQKMTAPADLVVFDSPPILLASDTSAIAAGVDGIVLVVARGTPLRVLAEVRERLDFVGTPLLGYVFNRARPGTEAYRYGGRYRYAYGEDEPLGGGQAGNGQPPTGQGVGGARPAGRRARRRAAARASDPNGEPA